MKLLNFILAVFIVLASLLPNMDTNELTKFTELVDHYHLHQEKCNFQGSFLEFLDLHYGSKNNDGHDHGNLPFKNCTHSFDYYFSLPTLSLEEDTTNIFEESLKNEAYHFSFVSNFFASIWQPPQL